MTGAVLPTVTATAMPYLDPAARVDLTLAPGLTLAQIVDLALPEGMPAEAVRVAIVSARGSQIVPRGCWGTVRPKPGVRVVIRVTPGKDGLRAILSVIVAVAAVALGQWWAAGMGFVQGTAGFSVASGLIGMGVSLVGQLLINALIPPTPPEDEKSRNRYSISGWRNRLEPDGAVPVVMGRLRTAPPFAARPYTEIVGDWQYVRAAFCVGYGPVEISDLKIGDTAIEEYDEVELELRQGLPGDAPLSLYPRQVVEESVGVELIRPWPRDDRGNIVDGEAELKPIVRTTGADASAVSVILAWQTGLFTVEKDDGGTHARAVVIAVERRRVQDEDWTAVETLVIRAEKKEAFFRQFTWEMPERATWQIRLTMQTNEADSERKQHRTHWVAMQTIRPEYPLDVPYPLALIGLRIKATHQINGALDNLSCIVAGLCPDWDHVTETWVTRQTSNPAALIRHALQSPANPKPVADGEIDLELLQDWHDFCRIKGLKYDRVLESTGSTLREVLIEIAAAGRASPRHDGLRWGVVIDRPQELVVDHLNPRNSSQFRLTRRYFTPPHGVRVKFPDATNDWKTAERIVPWPGHEGPIELTEVMEFPGKTDPAEIWIEARRRMYESLLRADQMQAMQDGAVGVATRGDLLMLSHDVLTSVQRAARVREVVGSAIVLDELVEMEAGTAYAIRFRQLSEADTVGTSVIRTVRTEAGETDFLTLEGAGQVPEAGDLVHFGPVSRLDRAVVVRGVETAEKQATILHLIDAAPEIDATLDAETPPAWSGRAGAEIGTSSSAPGVPRVVRIATGIAGTGEAAAIDVALAPGPGVPVGRYDIRHRITPAAWTELSVPAGSGGSLIVGYANGDPVTIQARAVSAVGVAGAWGDPVHVVVGEDDAPVPGALNGAAIAITTLPGCARVELVTPADAALARVQVYLSATTTLDRETDAWGAPFAAEGARRLILNVGDPGIVNLLSDPGFANPAAWTAQTDWTVSGGAATKVAGAAGRAIYQLVTAPGFVAGATVRCGVRITAYTAGEFKLRVGGTTSVSSAGAMAAVQLYATLTAPAAPAWIGVVADAAGAGSVDDIVAYIATAACLPQGTHHLWLEPQNAGGTPGPVSGPFTVTII